MASVVVDTHAIVWYLSKNPSLSKLAEATLDSTTANGSPIYVPSICLVELTYLIEKGRLPESARQILIDSLDHPGNSYVLVPLDRRVADALEFVSRQEVPDMPDRVIAATALVCQSPLVSRDRKIRLSRVQTIW